MVYIAVIFPKALHTKLSLLQLFDSQILVSDMLEEPESEC